MRVCEGSNATRGLVVVRVLFNVTNQTNVLSTRVRCDSMAAASGGSFAPE